MFGASFQNRSGFAKMSRPSACSKAGGREEENVMADFSRVSTMRSSDCWSPTTWKGPLPIPVILVVTVFALAGCNANQTVNPSGQANLGAIYPNYNPYNPASYAQTSGFYGGR